MALPQVSQRDREIAALTALLQQRKALHAANERIKSDALPRLTATPLSANEAAAGILAAKHPSKYAHSRFLQAEHVDAENGVDEASSSGW